MSEERKGVIYAILAFVFWGLVPIYFKAVKSVSPTEILVHRIFWSVIFLTILMIFTKQMSIFKNILRDKKKLKILFLTSVLISTNWLVFIWAISNNKITEASLGYYINPIVNVILGMFFFAEKPTKFQKIAILFATLAIINEIISFGSIPLVSIALALSFGFYGMLRKKISLPSMAGLYIETLIILPFAFIYFIYLVYTSQNAFVLPLNYISVLLISAGLITVIPLLWFNAAATRVSLVKLGFLQYFGPTIAFLLGVFVYHEPFNTNKLITFSLIWIALIFFTLDSKYSKK
ncbi:MAG: EamA family transporter RarD [Campylobacteraceae bacterium]|nr:EamA family transporter RarD [Campylobacteraceae bacterium]